MSDLDINEVLARNLRATMKGKGVTQTALGAKSGVKQNTISLYMAPEKRKQGASGKAPSGKLTEVALMAKALDMEAWQLLLPEGATPPPMDYRAAAEEVARKVPDPTNRDLFLNFLKAVDGYIEERQRIAVSIADTLIR